MPIWVNIRAVPRRDGDPCSAYMPAVWWPYSELAADPRFRVTNPGYFHAVACLSTEEMLELQGRYRSRAEGLDPWKRDSDRLDGELQDAENAGRWWVVSIYEWESGVE